MTTLTKTATDPLQLENDTELLALAEQLAPTEEPLETLSRIIWSHLAEPGDGVAGALIQTLGAKTALDLVAECKQYAADRAAIENTLTGFLPPELREPLMEAFTGDQLVEGLLRWGLRLTREPIRTYLLKATTRGITILLPTSALWPTKLNDLGAHAPTMLWVRGNPIHLAHPGLAVVGSRAVSHYGMDVTHDLTTVAAQAGAAIFSGAALGVDGAAHRAALALQTPTIAVLAGGVDRNYPTAHDELLQRIEEEGAICAESPPDTAPIKWRFLQRNRIIAALADATLVTAAAYRSGAINTAGHAATLGRPLGAVPGQITCPSSQGCHRIIKELDATPIFSGSDLRTLLGVTEQLFAYPAESEDAAADGATTESMALDGAASATGKQKRGNSQITGSAREGAARNTPVQPGNSARPGNSAPPTLGSPEQLRLWDALHPRSYRTLQAVAVSSGMDTIEAGRAIAEMELLGLVVSRAHHKTGEAVWRRSR